MCWHRSELRWPATVMVRILVWRAAQGCVVDPRARVLGRTTGLVLARVCCVHGVASLFCCRPPTADTAACNIQCTPCYTQSTPCNTQLNMLRATASAGRAFRFGCRAVALHSRAPLHSASLSARAHTPALQCAVAALQHTSAARAVPCRKRTA